MATFEELTDRVSNLVQDSSLDSLIPTLLNQGVQEIAGGMQSTLGSWITPPLPMLFKIDSVTTSTTNAYVNMPATFHRGLQLAVDASGKEISIANSFIEFSETYPMLDKVGKISEVVEHGRNLYYQGIPTVAETVKLHFYRLPVDMEDTDDVPDGIPSHLHINLLVNFAAWKIYEFIEDGIEGETPNTQKYMNAFLVALRTLELSIPDYTRGMVLR